MREGRRWTPADGVMLIGLLALAAAVGAFWMLGRETPTAVQVRYTVCISDQELPTGASPPWEALSAGDAVRSENGTAALGEVKAVQVRPHKAAVLRDGAFAAVEVPGRRDVYVTVEGVGSLQEGHGLRLSGIRIAAGATGGFCIGEWYVPSATVVFAEEGEVVE